MNSDKLGHISVL